MVFKKNDPETKKNSAKGKIARKENIRRENEMIVTAITGGFIPYEEKIQKIQKEEELTKPELDYMDRIEKWVEYSIPKLARKEVDITSKGDKIESVIFLPQKDEK